MDITISPSYFLMLQQENVWGWGVGCRQREVEIYGFCCCYDYGVIERVYLEGICELIL